MGQPQSRSWTWRFDSPPEDIWPMLADTARFNEAAKLPNHEIEERPRPDGSVEYLGRAKKGPFVLEWQEKPVNWVLNQWFEHRRTFRKGPLASLCATLRLTPEADGCRGDYTIEAASANPVGELILKTGFFTSAGRTFATLAETAAACARGERATPFDFEPPQPGPEIRRRIATMIEQIKQTGHDHGLAERLADLILTAQEVDLTQIRPLRLAREWSRDARPVIELCLEATRAGMLEMRWDLLCPRCRIAKAVVGSLDQLPGGTHCGTCNIDYDRDFSRNVELSFKPTGSLRPLHTGEYCLFGPMSTPHIVVHFTLEAGESRSVDAELEPGAFRLRTLEPGPEHDLEWAAGGFPEVIAEDTRMAVGSPGHPGRLQLTNRSQRQLTLIVEKRDWVKDALTADRVTSLQSFRDLFSDQVLRPGDEVAIARVALMFTDLRDSTALYSEVGDAAAYHLVREHFAFLGGIVRARNGAIIKTIGDAIMAAFQDPGDALQAALEIQDGVKSFNQASQEPQVVIKLGLHEGPCIAVTLNDKLDYFGTTVNMTARLQSQSVGNDIVVSREMAADPAVAESLALREPREDSARLKGFEDPITFFRITM